MEIILGVGASGLVQFLKKRYGLGEYKTLLTLAGVALAGAFLFQYLLSAGYWELVRETLVYAGAFYTFIVRRFE